MFRFNGIVYYNYGPKHVVHTDASQLAAGIFWKGDWQYLVWHREWPSARFLHINYKEILSIALAVKRWAPCWKNSIVYIHTDSMVAKGIWNKGRCKNDLVMNIMRNVFWLSVQYNFKLIFIHIPGILNVLPDSISRLHERGQIGNFRNVLSNWHHCRVPAINFVNNVNYESCIALLSQVLLWIWRQN